MTLGANLSFNATGHVREGFNHRTWKAESRVSHKRAIYMEGAGDGGSGGLGRTLSPVSYSCCTGKQDAVNIFDTCWRNFPSLKNAGTLHFASPCGNKSLGASRGQEPRSEDHCPLAEQGMVDGDLAFSSMQGASQLVRTGPEQSHTPSQPRQGN